MLNNYSVVKNYGHFTQIYDIEAESKEDAWNRADKDGKLRYQIVYEELTDTETKGHVTNLDEVNKRHKPISEEQYYIWMREAIEKGMHVKPHEYEKALGLPFCDVW